VDDIISQGEDPGSRGPWRRRLTIGAIVVVVLALLVVQHLPRSGQHRPRHAPQSTGSGPAATRPGAGSIPAFRPARPDGITGKSASWAASLRLPVGGVRPAWLWPATGRMQPIGGLSAQSDYVFTRVPGGWAVQPAAAASPSCAGCPSRPLPVYYLGDRAQSVTAIGVADRVAPAAEPGLLWLTSYPPGADPGSAAGSAQQVSVTGAPSGARIRLPAGYLIDAATEHGLLLTRIVQRGAAPVYDLWDPVLDKVSRTFHGVIAASAGQIAWTRGCAARCQVLVLDLATGRQTPITLPKGSSAARGTFSPDGSLLALELSFGNGGDGGAMATRLEVAAVPGGRLTVVPGTWASSDALTGFGWPSDGDSLVAKLSFLTKVQVASWHPGSRRLAVALVRPGQHPNELVVG
jgi:hypothetical protein